MIIAKRMDNYGPIGQALNSVYTDLRDHYKVPFSDAAVLVERITRSVSWSV